jgi:DNA-binding NarL/FixJ family response regulator
MHVGAEMVRASKRVGADGFVTKSEVSEVLLQAVDTLLSGRTFFPDVESAGNGTHAHQVG